MNVFAVKEASHRNQTANPTQIYLPEKSGGYDSRQTGGYHDYRLPIPDLAGDREKLFGIYEFTYGVRKEKKK